MAYALAQSGSPTVSTGVAGASVTPAYSTGAARVAGNLLVCVMAASGGGGTPTAPTGWSIAKAQTGTSCSAAIFYKIAAGGDAAPTVPAILSAVISAQVWEWSGNDTVSPSDQIAGAASITSPAVATAAGADAAGGELVVAAAAALYSTAATKTLAITLNNGVSNSLEFTNNGTSTVNHYDFSQNPTTGNGAADSGSFAFTTLKISGTALAVASFDLLAVAVTPRVPTPRVVGQAVQRAATWCKRNSGIVVPRLWTPADA